MICMIYIYDYLNIYWPMVIMQVLISGTPAKVLQPAVLAFIFFGTQFGDTTGVFCTF